MNTIVKTFPSDTRVITHKDLMNIFGYGERTAYKYLKDVKDHYNIKRVYYFHVKEYFELP